MDIYFGKIKLRALEPEDMEALRATVNDPEMEKMVVGWSFPVSKRQQMSWYERVIGNPTNHRFAVEYEGKFVGISTLTDIDWKNRSAFHGIKLTQDAPKGKGIGFDAVVAVMKYAFEELQLNRLYGGILEYNIASKKLYDIANVFLKKMPIMTKYRLPSSETSISNGKKRMVFHKN